MRYLLLLLCLVQCTNCYKILVYSAQFSNSHVSFMGHLADTLAEAGHDVIVYLPAFVDQVTMTGVKLARAIVNPRDFDLDFDPDATAKRHWSEQQQRDPRYLFTCNHPVIERRDMSEIVPAQLENTEMLQRLRNERFDLGVGEIFDWCSTAYFEALGLPKFVTAFSTPMIDIYLTPFGVESNPSFVPAIFSPFSDDMSYKQRLANLLLSLVVKLGDYTIVRPAVNELMKEQFGSNFDIQEQVRKNVFVFVNSEEFTEFPRPITHKFVYIGGIGVGKPGKLSEEFQNLMDNSTNGVVFISFGSVLKSSMMPLEKKQAFLSLFRQFPKMTFIWKYEADDDFGNDSPNLFKVKWAPQNDLFGHPNLKTFISHGGMNSVTECTHAGIPFIVIPIWGDQLRNAKMVQKRGVAYVIDKSNVTGQSLADALTAVTTNHRYRESAKRLQAMIAKKPFSAVERVVKYTEFAAEFGHIENLDLAATQLNFFQYYLLDILIPFACIVLLCFAVTLRLASCLWRKCVLRRKVKKD